MAPGFKVPKPRKSGRARHYEIDRWVDFARGLAPVNQAARMSIHAGGCARCRELMKFCAKLAATMHIMSPQRQPADAGFNAHD
jgi:hypothetical protein